MADFAGFQIETPQEMLKRINANRQEILSKGNVEEQQFVAADTLLKAVFGDPELDKAEARTAAATAAFTDLEQRSGEDDIDFRRRQTQAFFDNVKDVDPALAAQASQQLTALQNERIERDSLLAQEGRRETNEARLAAQESDRLRKRRREDVFDNLGYAVDRNTGKRQVFDLSSTSGVAEFNRAAQDPNNQILTRDELVELDEEKATEAESNFFNKSTRAKKLSTYSAATDTLDKTTRVLDILTAEPDTLTTPAKLEKGINNLVQDIGAATRATAVSLGGFEDDLEKVRGRISPAARARGVTDSMVLNLAYSLARTLDEGGRLSENDVKMAIDMVGGTNADPSVLARISLETAELNTQKITKAFDVLNTAESFRNSTDGKVLTAAQRTLEASRDQLRERAKRFIPQNEFDNIVFGVPIAPAPVTPATPSTTDSAGDIAEISITIPGL